MTELVDTLAVCQKWLDKYQKQGRAVGEQNTKAGLIEPIIEALGWNIHDLDEVHQEYKPTAHANPVDYALLLHRNPVLFVEAKGIGENLTDPKWISQLIGYAVVAGVQWVVLTNGVEWRIYNTHASVPIEDKLFKKLHIDEDNDEALAVLPLLSKSEMDENRIEAMWKSFFVDRSVKEILVAFFSGTEPEKAIVSAVRKKAPNLSLKDVRASLTRARASFEFPSVSGPLVGSGPSLNTQIPAKPKTKATGKPRHPAASKVPLLELVQAGWLSAGAEIQTEYLKQKQVATLRSDGQILYAGNIYATPTAAGKAVKVALLGEGIPRSVLSTDGWKFWRTNNPSGSLVTLRQLRELAQGPSVGGS